MAPEVNARLPGCRENKQEELSHVSVPAPMAPSRDWRNVQPVIVTVAAQRATRRVSDPTQAASVRCAVATTQHPPNNNGEQACRLAGRANTAAQNDARKPECPRIGAMQGTSEQRDFAWTETSMRTYSHRARRRCRLRHHPTVHHEHQSEPWIENRERGPVGSPSHHIGRRVVFKR